MLREVCCPLRCAPYPTGMLLPPYPSGMLREECFATRGMIWVVWALYFPEVIAILITDFTQLIDCSLMPNLISRIRRQKSISCLAVIVQLKTSLGGVGILLGRL
jgi:hypothetical protein